MGRGRKGWGEREREEGERGRKREKKTWICFPFIG